MVEKYRTNELAKFYYSDIGEYIDENHTDKPLRNDEIVKLLNDLSNENMKLKKRIDDFDEELLYYKTKCGGLEEELFKQDREISSLEKENKKLKQNNDIKFWKQQCMKMEKQNNILLNELRKAHNEGYDFSDKFKGYTEKLMKEIKEEIHN